MIVNFIVFFKRNIVNSVIQNTVYSFAEIKKECGRFRLVKIKNPAISNRVEFKIHWKNGQYL